MAQRVLRKRTVWREPRRQRRERRRSGLLGAWMSYAGALLISAGLAVFIGGPAAYTLLYLCLAVPVLALGHAVLCYYSIRILHKMEHMRLYRRESSRYSIRLVNRAVWPIPRIRFQFDEPGDGVPVTVTHECNLLPWQSAQRFFTLSFPHRGRYAFRIKKLHIFDGFGLFRFAVRFSSALHVTVYPRVPELRGYPQQYMGAAVGTARAFQDSDELSGESRKFMPGDSLSRIHRNLTARQNEIITRLYDPETETSCACYLDLRPVGGSEAAELEDTMIESALAALHYWVTKLGMSVSFACCLEDGIHSVRVRSAEDYLMVLELCAMVRFAAALPPELLLQRTGAMPYAALFTAAPPSETLLRSFGAGVSADIFCFSPDEKEATEHSLQSLRIHWMKPDNSFVQWTEREL